jgi:hypothetical protein
MHARGHQSVTKVLIGLQQVGVVGLREALKDADASGLTERKAIVDRITEALAPHNYIPASAVEPYRQAVWREFLRHRGEDFRHVYSEIDVVVRGVPGDERDRFVETLVSVFGDFELKPRIAFAPPEAEGPYPQLLICDEPIVKGFLNRKDFTQTVRKHISHW